MDSLEAERLIQQYAKSIKEKESQVNKIFEDIQSETDRLADLLNKKSLKNTEEKPKPTQPRIFNVIRSKSTTSTDSEYFPEVGNSTGNDNVQKLKEKFESERKSIKSGGESDVKDLKLIRISEDAQREEEINRKKKQQLEQDRLAEEQRQQSIEKLSKQNLQQKTSETNAESLSQQLNIEASIEGSSVVEQQEAPLKRSNYIITSKSGKKYDLSTWKYSELRDSIHTSCDVELLSACREEFHRRLKVYHAWKARNSSSSTPSDNSASKEITKEDSSSRAPKSIYQYQQSNSNSSAIKIDPNQNRYFRIPFVKEGMNKGLWYAHFVGEFIQRQMEVDGGDAAAVLLVAGRDDMQMCELKLSETGLIRKKGAEILEYDFEKEWARLS